jgi:hypothetical protein
MDAFEGHYVKLARVRKTKAACFLSYWKIDPKDKHVHRNKHDDIYIYMKNMFVIVELLCGTQEEGKEKKMIVNNITMHYICAGRRCNVY